MAVRPLSAEEREALAALAAGQDAALARRAQIVLSRDEGLALSQIAQRVGVSVSTVARWLKAFAARRLAIFPQQALADTTPAASAERITVAELCRRFHVDIAHGMHVGRLAAELFDLTALLHQLDARWREVIFNAGLLHNVAFSGGAAAHHTRGRDILLEHPLSDLDDADRAIIACTTAFHRKGWKTSRLENEPSYTALPPEHALVALRLAALLRIADGLDYSQSQTTILGPCRVEPGGVSITVAGPFADTDAARADQKADMWRAQFETPITIAPYDDRAAVEDAQAAPDHPGLQPDDLMSEAGRKVLRFHFERMLLHEPGTRAGEDIEALHDMRVATRRMRAAFRVFGAAYRPKLRRRLLRELRGTGSVLGAVRDLDVFMENTRRYLQTLPEERRGELDLLFGVLQQRREKARGAMLEYLDGEQYRAFVEDFGAFVSTPGMGSLDADVAGPVPVLVRHVAPRLIYERYEAVRAYETVLDGAPIQMLHALRIDGKRLRYTLEFFREVLGSEADDVIRAVVALQDHLGALNDAAVAQGLLRSVMRKARKQARKQQAADPDAQPDLDGIAAYLDHLEQALADLQRGAPQVLQAVVSAEMRHRLALAISVL